MILDREALRVSQHQQNSLLQQPQLPRRRSLPSRPHHLNLKRSSNQSPHPQSSLPNPLRSPLRSPLKSLLRSLPRSPLRSLLRSLLTSQQLPKSNSPLTRSHSPLPPVASSHQLPSSQSNSKSKPRPSFRRRSPMVTWKGSSSTAPTSASHTSTGTSSPSDCTIGRERRSLSSQEPGMPVHTSKSATTNSPTGPKVSTKNSSDTQLRWKNRPRITCTQPMVSPLLILSIGGARAMSAPWQTLACADLTGLSQPTVPLKAPLPCSKASSPNFQSSSYSTALDPQLGALEAPCQPLSTIWRPVMP